MFTASLHIFWIIKLSGINFNIAGLYFTASLKYFWWVQGG